MQIASPKEIYEIELPLEQKYVHFVDGNIPYFGKSIYEQLEETTNLTITNCRLEQLFISDTLVHLNASHNQLTRIEFSRTGDYSALVLLDLCHNNLSRVPNVKTFVQLEVLELSNNAIELLMLDVLEPLSNLKSLSLANNHIQSFVSRVHFQLRSLTELQLSNNTLMEFTADNWTLPALSRLDLDGNQLFYLNSEDLHRAFPNLSQINLTGNNWNCRGLSALLQYLHRQSISHSPAEAASSCATDDQTSLKGICCIRSYLNYVTLQTQWDIRKLQQDMRAMNGTLVTDLAQVRADQSYDIGMLERQLAQQERHMFRMRNHLVQMAQVIENLLEELFLRQSEAAIGKQQHSREKRPAMLIF